MKLINQFKLCFVLFCILMPNKIFTTKIKNSEPTKEEEAKKQESKQMAEPNKDIKTSKFLFMYKYPLVQNEPNHKLNKFTYKNVIFSTEQIVYFESINEGDPNNDDKFDTAKYLITMRYEFLDTPCLNKSFVCTHSQFMKEYKPTYPEIDYTIPKEVLEIFGEPSKASDQCLLILMQPVLGVKEAAWLCHMDLKTILEIQIKISKIIYDSNTKSYEFVSDYIQSKSTVHKGVMKIDKETFTFTDMSKKQIIQGFWRDVEPYATALYLKEELEWKGSGTKPDSQRCLKFFRKAEVENKNPDYFCAYFHRNDVTRKMLMSMTQGRFAAEMYTNKINIRLQAASLKVNVMTLSKSNQQSLEIDSIILFTLKIEVRKIYFFKRHIYINQIRLGMMKKSELKTRLVQTKISAIKKVCGGVELCIRALNFSVDKGYLPLKGIREKFSWDLQNPYHSRMAKVNIRIDNVNKKSMGKKIMSAVAKMKGTQSYFAEKIKESAAGQLPNVTTIKKAFNTMFSLRDKKEYKSFHEVSTSCKAGERNSSSNIRRKISFLWFAGDNDVFFEYLGFIRDFQLTKN